MKASLMATLSLKLKRSGNTMQSEENDKDPFSVRDCLWCHRVWHARISLDPSLIWLNYEFFFYNNASRSSVSIQPIGHQQVKG